MSADPDFAARLERIRSQKGQATLMVGHDEQYLLPRKEVPQIARHREIAENLIYPGSLLGALLLGMFGVFVGRYVHFQLLSSVAELQDPMSELLFGAIFGLAASFVLSQAFKLTSKEHRSLQGMGVFVMACMFHNLAHWAPGPMSLAFSPDYVAEVVASTPRSSFRLGGGYYPLFDSSAPAAPAQVVMAAAPASGDVLGDVTQDCATPQAAAPAAPAKPKVWALNSKHKSNGPKTIHTPSETDSTAALPTPACP